MRAKILIEVELDPVPGWGYNVEDFVKYLKSTARIRHYVKDVTLVFDSPRELSLLDSELDGRDGGNLLCSTSD